MWLGGLFLSIFCMTVVSSRSYDVFRYPKDSIDDDVFSFASYYQDHMVLQRGQPLLWGYGTLGAIVKLKIKQETYVSIVRSGPTGKGIWSFHLIALEYGGPYNITVVQNNIGNEKQLMLHDVLFGDVWVCGGQSNIQFALSQAFNASEEIKRASNYPNIRLMTVALKQADDPLYDLPGIEQNWVPASNASVGGAPWTYFSAVCWLYGSYLYDQLQVPIGLVASNWGGTPVEAWSSTRALKECGLDKLSGIDRDSEVKFGGPQGDSVLWNAMIHPLLNMTIKGVVWYQGEQNHNYHCAQYSCSFPAMIRDWRRSWFEGNFNLIEPEFPFGFVQIGTWNVTDDGTFPLIRWHQTADHGYVPNKDMPKTFMAVAMDMPDDQSPYGSIHPRDKQDVGKRLAMASLNTVYGLDFSASGPIIKSAVQSDDRHVIVNYPIGEKLLVKERGNFAVCCSFTKCNISEPSPSANWLWARIKSSTSYTITLDVQPCVKGGGHASMIRYAWAEEPCLFKDCSVYNQAGLPAPPFVISVTSK